MLLPHRPDPRAVRNFKPYAVETGLFLDTMINTGAADALIQNYSDSTFH